jgi:protein CpxP
MEPSRNNLKFWKLLALLVSVWVRPKEQAPGVQERGRDGGPGEHIIKTLQFNEQQTDSFNVLRTHHHAAMLELQHEGGQIRDLLFNVLKTNTPDQHLADSLENAIAQNQKQIEQVTFRHFVAVRALCDDRQKKTFDSIINDVLHTMAQPPVRRRDGRPGGPPNGSDDRPGPPPGEGDNGRPGPPPGR